MAGAQLEDEVVEQRRRCARYDVEGVREVVGRVRPRDYLQTVLSVMRKAFNMRANGFVVSDAARRAAACAHKPSTTPLNVRTDLVDIIEGS